MLSARGAAPLGQMVSALVSAAAGAAVVTLASPSVAVGHMGSVPFDGAWFLAWLWRGRGDGGGGGVC